MEKIKSFFEDVQNCKFKTRIGGKIFHDFILIKKDERFKEVQNFIYEKYVIDGRGIKSIIKDYGLQITYSVLRFYIINFFEIEIRKNNEITQFLKEIRQKKALFEKENKMGFFSDGVQEKIKIKTSNKRGVQGYYFNKSQEKYVWLRSSWEYIYAKWLDEQNIKWDVECITFNLNDITYRPDFFIFDEQNNIIKIVEVKGYWKDKLYKFNILKEELKNIDFILVDKISPYTKNSFKTELKNWKKIKKNNY